MAKKIAWLHGLVTRLNLPHEVIVGLDVPKIGVVILTPAMTDIIGVWAVAYPCR